MNRRMRFGCGHVCQHDPPWAGDVANGIHAGDRCFQRIVDDDPPALVKRNPRFGQSCGIRDPAHGNANGGSVQDTGIARPCGERRYFHRRPAVTRSHAGNRMGQFHGDALFLHFSEQQTADFAVYGWQGKQTPLPFDDRHFRTEGAVDESEIHNR